MFKNKFSNLSKKCSCIIALISQDLIVELLIFFIRIITVHLLFVIKLGY